MHKNKITTVVILFLFILVNSNSLLASETIVPVYGLLFPAEDGLSESQQQFVDVIGYPQRFIKTFDIENGKKRVNETWGYASYSFAESFINGQYVREDDLQFLNSSLPPGNLHPEDYHFTDTQQDIIELHGPPKKIYQDQIWNGSLTIYIYDSIVFTFNNNQLQTVVYCSY